MAIALSRYTLVRAQAMEALAASDSLPDELPESESVKKVTNSERN